jgi:hypothetical protein
MVPRPGRGDEHGDVVDGRAAVQADPAVLVSPHDVSLLR